jgi:hypothetical protein
VFKLLEITEFLYPEALVVFMNFRFMSWARAGYVVVTCEKPSDKEYRYATLNDGDTFWEMRR